MNIENIKSQFPIFSKKINGKPLVYLDSSNSSQKPLCVINKLNDFYKNEFSNIGRSIHSLAVNATNKFEETRMSVKNRSIYLLHTSVFVMNWNYLNKPMVYRLLF